MINIKNTVYSFDDLLNAPFVEIYGKVFENIQTKEILGIIWAKYPKNFNLKSTLTGGTIQFLSDDNTITKINGSDLNQTLKIFKC
jgi:hypothetical protein